MLHSLKIMFDQGSRSELVVKEQPSRESEMEVTGAVVAKAVVAKCPSGGGGEGLVGEKYHPLALPIEGKGWR